MLFTRNISDLLIKKSTAQLWALGIYQNPLLCSKYILAKALMEKAFQEKPKDLSEVVCVSVGNLAVSIAYLSHRYNVKPTLYLPAKVPPRIHDLLHILGANIIQCDDYDVASKAIPEARAYVEEKPTYRAFLDQYDTDWCADVYRREIFRYLKRYAPFRDCQRQTHFVVPFGTGALFLSTCQFLQNLQSGPHSVVPAGLRINNERKQGVIDKVANNYNQVSIILGDESQAVEEDLRTETFGIFLPVFNPPLGTASADCLAVAVKHFQAVCDQPINIIAILTDSLMSSHFFI